MNLSNIYSKLHPYRNDIKPGMTVYYTDMANNEKFEVLESDGVELTVKSDDTGDIETMSYENLQYGWELSRKDQEFIEAIRPVKPGDKVKVTRNYDLFQKGDIFTVKDVKACKNISGEIYHAFTIVENGEFVYWYAYPSTNYKFEKVTK